MSSDLTGDDQNGEPAATHEPPPAYPTIGTVEADRGESPDIELMNQDPDVGGESSPGSAG
jgi:hypothetical protein